MRRKKEGKGCSTQWESGGMMRIYGGIGGVQGGILWVWEGEEEGGGGSEKVLICSFAYIG